MLFRLCLLLVVLVALLPGASRPLRAAQQTQKDPTAACTTGIVLLLMGMVVDGTEQLEAGFEGLRDGAPDTQKMLGMCALWLGIQRQSLGDWSGAVDAYQVAQMEFEQEGNTQLHWATLYAIGSIYSVQGQPSLGEQELQTAEKLLAEEGNWFPANLKTVAAAATANNLGVALAGQEELEAAAEKLNQAQSMFVDLRSAAPQPAAAAQPAPTAQSGLLGGRFGNGAIRQTATALREQRRSGTSNAAVGDCGLGLRDLLQRDDGTTSLRDHILECFQNANTSERPRLIERLLGDEQQRRGVGVLELIRRSGQGLGRLRQPRGGIFGGSDVNLADMVLNMSAFPHAVVWNNLGEVSRLQGQRAAADQAYVRALEILDQVAQTDSSSSLINPALFVQANRAITENNIGMLNYDQGLAASEPTEQRTFFKQALKHYEASRAMMADIEQRIGEAAALTNMGRMQQLLGDPQAALDSYEKAIQKVESIQLVAEAALPDLVEQGALQTSNRASLSGVLAVHADVYNFAVHLLHAQGRDKEAFEMSERGRARLFRELVAAGRLQVQDQEASARLKQLRRAQALQQAAGDILEQAKQMPADKPRDLIAQRLMLKRMEEQKNKADKQYQAAKRAVDGYDNAVLKLITQDAAQPTLADTQQALPADTALVVYYMDILTQSPTLAFVIKKGGFEVIELPDASLAKLGDVRKQLREEWQISSSDPYPALLQQWHAAIVGPLLPKLQGIKQVGIVPHQSMHYLPFAALHDGQRFFGAQFSLFVLPSTSTLPLVQSTADVRPAQLTNAVVLGNPAGPPTPGVQALAFAQAEARSVAALFGAQAHTGSVATPALLRKEAPTASIVHLAAHGIYTETARISDTIASPLDSAVLLAPSADDSDGRLTTSDIFNLNLGVNQLVVLSACDTGVGELSRGDEVVGLTRAFFTAGSPTVISSLWFVNDRSTKELMAAFYTHWREDGMSKADALRAAQAEVRARYPSPYYWAAFVLNGNPE